MPSKNWTKTSYYRMFGQKNRTGTLIARSLFEEQHKKTDDCRIIQDSAHKKNMTYMTLFPNFKTHIKRSSNSMTENLI